MYTVRSYGNFNPSKHKKGLYKGDTKIHEAGRSYNLCIYNPSTKQWTNSTYDVWGYISESNRLTAAINAAEDDEIIVLYAFDEPRTNRSAGGLPNAVYSIGGSKEMFSAKIGRWYAYALVGRKNLGPGNGLEAVSDQHEGHNPDFAEVSLSFVISPQGTVDFDYKGKLTDSIDGAKASISSLSDVVVSNNEALSRRIDSVTAKAGANESAIQSEITARTDADSALSSRIDSVTAKAAQNEAAITAEATARADADKAFASSMQTISAEVTSNKENAGDLYTVRSYGSFNPSKHKKGLYKGDTKIHEAGRSYNLCIYNPSTKQWTNSTYDVWGYISESNRLTAAINAAADDEIIVLYAFDEPRTNRSAGGLPNAVYSIGGSKEMFSAKIGRWYAYALVGRKNLGPGNGLEAVSDQHEGHNPDFAEVSLSFVISPQGTVDFDYKGKLTDSIDGAKASIATLNQTIADTEHTLAQQITQLESEFDGKTAAIQQELTTTVNKVGEVESKYSVKVDNNGYVSGFGLISTENNGVPTSEFAVRADKFFIAAPAGSNYDGGDNKYPFIVQNGKVYMRNAVIQNGAIDSAKIANVIQSTNYVPGKSGWKLPKNGAAEFNSDVVVNAQIQANSIVGDIVSAISKPASPKTQYKHATYTGLFGTVSITHARPFDRTLVISVGFRVAAISDSEGGTNVQTGWVECVSSKYGNSKSFRRRVQSIKDDPVNHATQDGVEQIVYSIPANTKGSISIYGYSEISEIGGYCRIYPVNGNPESESTSGVFFAQLFKNGADLV
ncbi:hypothetical protein MARILYN_57 [Vibrio phage Marilyn]|nr:hypothetical protein MARILYN_57 [Vibrio phage Marilyn]